MPEDVIAGRYRLLEPLGRGAMSAVWLAFDTELEREVAVKTLAPTADRARFRREARAVAALSHPNICALYDYGESEGKPYMVLEHLSGGSLEARLTAGTPLPDDETRRLAAAVAAGLAHAHERGLVHRDLKPSNVLFDAESRPKIADFGIARMGGEGTLTEAGTVLGTAAYISPEQAAGLPATAASDVYSFGVILFRMLTGRLPFVADSAMELVRLNRDVAAPSVASVRHDVPAQLGHTADAALAKDPARRPADGGALVAALEGRPARTAPPLPPASVEDATRVLPRPRRRSRRPALLLLALALALAMLAGGAALAVVLTDRGGSGGAPSGSTPSLSVPTAPTVGASTAATSTAATSTSASTTAPTTAPSTTGRTTTTTPTTTAHTTTAHVTTAPTTTAPLTTTSFPTTTSVTTAQTTTAATATTSAATTDSTTTAAAPPAPTAP